MIPRSQFNNYGPNEFEYFIRQVIAKDEFFGANEADQVAKEIVQFFSTYENIPLAKRDSQFYLKIYSEVCIKQLKQSYECFKTITDAKRLVLCTANHLGTYAKNNIKSELENLALYSSPFQSKVATRFGDDTWSVSKTPQIIK